MEKAKTIAVNMAVAALIALVLIWGNTRYRQGAQLSRGEKAAAAGDMVTAIAGYEAAIHMYTPGSSLTGQAAARLWALGEAAERTGDLDRALIAYRSLRSSFYAVRWVFQPGRDWIARCDAKIAELVKIQAEIAKKQGK
jgi:hypothetical protein